MKTPLAFGIALLAAPAMLGAQWVPPQSPCDIKPGHFRINSAVVNLKAAAEKPNQRDRMLAQTVDVLTRAISGDKQEGNPAAWYYLGRYYVEKADAMGADSAFDRAVALAPECREDVDRYRRTLWVDTYNAAQRAQQTGQVDSAALLYRAAHALVPADHRPLYALGAMYSARDQIDSASAYLRQAARASAGDTAYAEARRDALSQVARLHFRAAQGAPQVQVLARTRFSQDSLERQILVDSIILGRYEASSAARRARGARLSPADQQSFTRDSAGRAESLAAGRAARATLATAAGRDSAAAAALLGRAIAASREFLEAYPDEGEAVSALALLYAQSGRTAEAAAAFDAIYAPSAPLDGEVIVDAGRRAGRVGLTSVAATLLARGLEKAPYDRDGWNDLALVYRQLRDGQAMLRAGRRLVAIDPLNRTAVRQVATAFEVLEEADSARQYHAVADTGIRVEITVASFVQGQAGHVLTGIAANGRDRPSTPLRLTFEFLDKSGQTVASQAVTIPTIAATGTHQFEVRVGNPEVRGWRYQLN